MVASAGVEAAEVGPRDGLQGEPGVLPTATRVEFIRRAIEAGARRIEVASFVNPKKVPRMADAEDVLRALPHRADVRYIGLVLNRRGLERAAAAGCEEIGMAVVASDAFTRRNQGVATDASIARGSTSPDAWPRRGPSRDRPGRHDRRGRHRRR